MGKVLSSAERLILRHLARAVCPPGEKLPAPDEAFVDRVDMFLAQAPWIARFGLRLLLWAYELGSVFYGPWLTRSSRLDEARQARYLDAWAHNIVPALRLSMRGLVSLVKICWYADHRISALIGYRPPPPPPPSSEPPLVRHPRVLEAPGGRVRAEVIVVGTGAGGAVVACELAKAGRDVVMVEEGAYYTREHFNRRPFEMARLMYRDLGMTMALGRAAIALPLGRAVGGTTIINSGTCFRVPDEVLERWRGRGLEFTPQQLDPYYRRVEQAIGVTEVSEELLGVNGRLVRDAAKSLGMHPRPIRRNAPGCRGSGVCCFGCPTDGKRSMNVSYVPDALDAGARLYTEVRVERVLSDGQRATGVRGRTRQGKEVIFEADRVIVACGTIYTPLLLSRSGVRHRELGRNLTIHPASRVNALFDREIAGWEGVPQGLYIDDFADEGIMFEGSTTPPDYASISFPFVGKELTRVMESLSRISSFGFMIEDTGSGRVVRGPDGRPLVLYDFRPEDVQRIRRGTEILARIYFHAGAREVFTSIHEFGALRSEADLERLRTAPLHPSSFDLAAFHPLGTARMAADADGGVIGPDFQTWDLRGLHVVDGSIFPSALGVNPQLTIMAFATLAAERIDEQLRAGGKRLAA